jgi:hypothetical protein
MFMRANQFKAADALAMYMKGLTWREENGVAQMMMGSLHSPPPVLAAVDGQRRLQALYPHLMAGYDRDGRPVRVECMGRIRTKLLYELATEEELMRYHAVQRTGHYINWR